jgi:hypothetical protein
MTAPAVVVIPCTLEELRQMIREENAALHAPPTAGATVSIRKCGLPDATRKRATRAGKLPTFRVGRELHVRVADVAAFIEAGRVERADVSPELARAMRGGR